MALVDRQCRGRNKKYRIDKRCWDCPNYRSSCEIERRIYDTCYLYNFFEGQDSAKLIEELKKTGISYIGFITVEILGEIYKRFIKEYNQLENEEEKIAIIQKFKDFTDLIKKFQVLNVQADTDETYNELKGQCRSGEKDIRSLALAITNGITKFFTYDEELKGDRNTIKKISQDRRHYKIRVL